MFTHSLSAIWWKTLAAMVVLATASSAFGTTYIYVDPASGTETGASWATAWHTLRSALNDAAGVTGPVEIDVMATADDYPGDPTTPARTDTFTLRSDLTLKGGWHLYGGVLVPGDDPGSPSSSTIDGSGGGSLPLIYNLIRMDSLSNVEINHFRLVRGHNYRDSGGEPALLRPGSALSISECSDIRVIGCFFNDNWSAIGAGAVFLGDSSAVIKDCIFSENNSHGTSGLGTFDSPGGTFYVDDEGSGSIRFENCTFEETTGQLGGIGVVDMSTSETVPFLATFVHCTFGTEVVGLEAAGGVECEGGGAYFSCCKFESCVTGGDGGALYILGNADSPTVVGVASCSFETNHADGNGAAIYADDASVAITNCSFRGNIADLSNAGTGVGGGVYHVGGVLSIENCILYENQDHTGTTTFSAQFAGSTSDLTIQYSDIRGLNLSTYPTGNIDSDPLFPLSGTGPLGSGSPCIDTGSNALVPYDFADANDNSVTTGEAIPYDFALQTRIWGWPRHVDMGAWEDQTCPCYADFNGDGDVGTDADIEAFYACLAGNCCSTCPSNADINCDGDVGTDEDVTLFWSELSGCP